MTGKTKKEITGVRIKLATPERIHEISCGEVTKPETINYRTLRPETDGLFCEKIFGPTRSYECKCGKYKRSGPKFKGVICEHCGVEVTDNRVRRERMGHIDLAVPVVHIWYLRGIPSRLSLLLGTSAKDLEKVVYFAPTRKNEKAYKVTGTNHPEIVSVGSVICESERKIHKYYDPEGFVCEDAYTIENVESVPVNVGDIISPQTLTRYKSDYGDDSFSAEPAFILSEPDENSEMEIGTIIPASKVETTPGTFIRAKSGTNEAFIVTGVNKLPFSKGEVLSRSELTFFENKYPGHFKVIEHENVVDDPCHIVIIPGNSPFKQGEVIYERQQNLCCEYDKNFEAGIGADGVQTLINKLDLDLLSVALREEIADSTDQKKRKLVKRLQVCEDFRKSESKPQSMILNVLPVIPPDLRPLVQLDGGRFATSDLNDLYRRVINRNNRLKKLQQLHAPEIIIRNEKRMLQECVDALIDNGRVGKAVLGAGNRPLKSLTDLLRGKKGRFRQNLLGKRVDYSGRSVIVIGPELKIYQCGLPKQMALELFKPFVIRRLVEGGLTSSVKSAKRDIEKGGDQIWEILENIIKDHPVLLNRAPTLHRLGIQAFEPVLMEGKAIRLHPMVCTAFNADFDGDQMAVHVPLSIEAQAEARLLMLSANNLLSPASGSPVVTPTQDIVLGVYYLTDIRDGKPGEGKYFANENDIMSAMSHNLVHVNAKIWLKEESEELHKAQGRRKYVIGDKDFIVDSFEDVPAEARLIFIETTPGRVLFNSRLPDALRFVNKKLDKGGIKKLLDQAYNSIDRAGVVKMLDEIKSLGYHWAARSGISFGVQAVRIPDEKATITKATQAEDDIAKENYEMGLLTHDEYLDQKSKLWGQATKDIADKIKEHMSPDNPVLMMVESGARGSLGQMGQMAGIRGLMADPTGKTIDYPITANFREGMNMLEYFISTHGARKGLADTALRTAKSGYLTRRLVDVAQDLIITEHDCGTNKGFCLRPLTSEGKIMIGIAERIAGRTALHDIEVNGKLIVKSGEIITHAIADEIEAAGINEVWVRSPLACGLKKGVCQKCYGHDLSSRQLVPIGEAVGVVAAQSIGEPGTQLTMRTFHTGGVRSAEDITQGLPRIEQLFEVRRPRKVCILAGLDGTVSEIVSEGKRRVVIINDEGEKVTQTIPSGQDLKDGIEVGMQVTRLTPLTEGSIDPQQLLEVEGIDAVQRMLVDEIQYVYHSQGVSINNKHIEVILRKVAPLNKLKVIKEGDTSFVGGDMIWEDEINNVKTLIDSDNSERIKGACELFSGDILKSVKGADPEIEELVGHKIDQELLTKLLTPGVAITSMTLEHNGTDLDVIIGKAAFYKQMEGLRLMRDVRLGNLKIKKGTSLKSDELRRLTSQTVPPIIKVRNRFLLDNMVGNRWLAEDIPLQGKEQKFIPADSLLDEKVAIKIYDAGIKEYKVWHVTEHINVIEMLKSTLMGRDFFGKELINYDGDKKTVDEEIIQGIADGSIEKIETEDGIFMHDEIMERFLISKLKNKVLLNVEFSEDKSEVDPDNKFISGLELKTAVIEELALKNPVHIYVRASNAKYDEAKIVMDVTFVQKLREMPDCRPFIHGITKAALATDSFLSAASFQQTAQVLAGAAVRAQLDPLHGLKENVIIGHLIPAGTGSEAFRSMAYQGNDFILKNVAEIKTDDKKADSPEIKGSDIFVNSESK